MLPTKLNGETVAETNAIMQLLRLFDSLAGKLAWDRDLKLASFKNLDSAKAFKAAAPAWKVQFFDWAQWDRKPIGASLYIARSD